MTRSRIPRRTGRARRLRRDMTEAETVLWTHLRGRALTCRFRRQLPIGQCYADFACLSHRLIVELDGEQHFESRYDRRRDAWVQAQGFTILRFWNNEVLGNLPVVLDTISRHCHP